MNRQLYPIFESILDDFEQSYTVDSKSFHVHHNGHRNFYTEHYCPVCETSSECTVRLCRLESTVECLDCLRRLLLEDTERISKQAREFLKTALPTSDNELMWWRAVRAEIDGKLKGLAERAAEVLRRQDSEVK